MWGLSPKLFPSPAEMDIESPCRSPDGRVPFVVVLNPKLRRRVIIAGALFLWSGAVLAGTRMLLNYETTPGPIGNIAVQWPRTSRISLASDKYTLVMLVHPNCPCTRASIAELEILTTRLQGKLAAFVLFSKPAAKASEVRGSGLWQRAALIPGVAVRYDENGFETAQFGGLVSGETVVYDPEGHLVFSGGITAGRGHQGDNAGLDDIIAAVIGKSRSRAQITPVFGCALHDPTPKELSEEVWKKQ